MAGQLCDWLSDRHRHYAKVPRNESGREYNGIFLARNSFLIIMTRCAKRATLLYLIRGFEIIRRIPTPTVGIPYRSRIESFPRCSLPSSPFPYPLASPVPAKFSHSGEMESISREKLKNLRVFRMNFVRAAKFSRVPIYSTIVRSLSGSLSFYNHLCRAFSHTRSVV